MKRNILIALVLSLMLTVCASALDFSPLTLDDLYALKSMVEDEIAKRLAGDDLSSVITLYSQDGIGIYMSDTMDVKDSTLYFDYTFSNQTDQDLYFIPYNGIMGVNDWVVNYDMFCSVPAGYKRVYHVEASLADTNIDEFSDIETVAPVVRVLDQAREILIDLAGKEIILAK